MKKKGFVLVETIVVVVVLTIGLVAIYSSFSSLLANDKRRATYNDVAYIYRTYYIEDFLTSLNIEDWLDYYLGEEVKDASGNIIHGGKKIQQFSCNNPNLYKIDGNTTNQGLIDNNLTASTANLPNSEYVKLTFCETMLSNLGVKNVYITNYNVNDLKLCTTRGGIASSCNKNNPENYRKYEALYTMNTNMIYYLRTLSGKSDGDYRIIVEYEEKEYDKDDTITKVKKQGALVCPDGYKEDVDGICQRQIIRNYYSNTKLSKRAQEEDEEEEYVVGTATFDTGKSFNTKLKTLAKGSSVSSYSSTDNIISSFQRASTMSNEQKIRSVIISSSDSKEPIYAWLDGTNIYWYTEAEEIYYNKDSSYMFKEFTGIKTIDIKDIDSSNTLNMYGMFSGMSSLTNIDLGDKFDTSKVINMGDMFHGMGLTSLDLGNKFDTSLVINMYYMFGWMRKLTSLDLGDKFNTSNVLDMGSMFYFNSLSSLDLGDKFDTSSVYNMEFMFSNMSRLTSIDVSGFNTSNVTNMGAMFSATSSLMELNVNNFNTSKVTNMQLMFSDCGVSELNLSNFNTSNVTDMSAMFHGMSKLTNINIGSFDTSKVTDMAAMFYNISKLNNLSIKNFNTSNVTNMSGMFAESKNINILDLSNFNTSKVTNMANMFVNMDNITSLDLSSFDTSNVTNMSGMFWSMDKITELDLSTFDTSNVVQTHDNYEFFANNRKFAYGPGNTSHGMFGECNNLKTIYVDDKWTMDKVTSANSVDMFSMSYNIVGSKGTKYTYAHIDKLYAHIDGGTSNPGYLSKKIDPNAYAEFDSGAAINRKLKSLAAGKNVEFYSDDTIIKSFQRSSVLKSTYIEISSSNSSIPIYAYIENGNVYWYSDTDNVRFGSSSSSLFYYMKGIEKIDLSGISSQFTDKMASMFSNTKSLTNLTFGNEFDTSNVTDMYAMFYGMSKITSIDLSTFNTTNVTNMSYMFYEMNGLTSLNLGNNFNTSKVTNMTSMFSNVRKLTSLNLNNFNTSNVTSMFGMFNGMSSLTSLDVSSFNTSKVTNMGSMFNGMSGLTNLNLGNNFDTSKVTNMAHMFDGVSSLTSLNFKNKFITSNVEDMSYMFSGMRKLTSIDVSDFNTSKVTNMRSMFSNMNSLTSLNISNFDTSKVTNMAIMFNNDYKITSLDLSNFNTSKVTLMCGMFYGMSSLTSLDLSSFDTSSVVDMAGMFADVQKLNSLSVNHFNTENVRSMLGMFWNMFGLNSINISNFNTSNVENMAHMFGGLYRISSINLSNFNTSKVTDMSGMFYGMNGLTSLDLSNFDTSNLKKTSNYVDIDAFDGSWSASYYGSDSYRGMFQSSINLKTIYVGNKWNMSNVTKSDTMFSSASSLVGGSGTRYNSSYTDKTYARIDGGTSSPGYLTRR
ncbi:MAG: BspA family leucine-rich repeat surface protein [Bacilli bacterium]|nr:BspA family leucine-rich repeat surface protein [Bacilli bacterium]